MVQYSSWVLSPKIISFSKLFVKYILTQNLAEDGPAVFAQASASSVKRVGELHEGVTFVHGDPCNKHLVSIISNLDFLHWRPTWATTRQTIIGGYRINMQLKQLFVSAVPWDKIFSLEPILWRAANYTSAHLRLPVQSGSLFLAEHKALAFVNTYTGSLLNATTSSKMDLFRDKGLAFTNHPRIYRHLLYLD